MGNKFIECSNDEYREMEGISSSDLKVMVKSMAHWKYYHDHPDDKDSPSLLFGRAYHKYCLEPSTFYDEFAIAPSIDRRTKAGKEEYQKFVDESQGKDIISEDDFNTIMEMRDALYATPYARNLLYGEHEKSFFWVDEKTGITCKCRPDSYGKVGNMNICVDLKTTSDAETDAFMKSAINFNYDIQAAHYCEGLKQMTGDDFTFVFIAQEKKPPYAVNILQADEYFMKSGNDVREALLETYKECVERNEFPSYMGFKDDIEISNLSLPSWLKKAYESEE